MSDDLLRLLTLQDWNTRLAVVGTGLLGIGAGAIGSLAVLRRRALMGDALAHAALPGLWLAFLIMGQRSFSGLLLGAAASATLGVLTVTFIRHHSRIKEDAAIGIVLSVFFAAGLCLSRVLQSAGIGNTAGLDAYIFGKAASMLLEDVQAIGLVTAVVLLGVALFYKEFRLLCFDRQFAAALGWPVVLLDLWLMALLVLCTVIGLPAVGVVLMAALLITPAAAARFWTRRLSGMILLSSLFGCLAGVIGSGLSALDANLSTGPAVVLSAATIFGISLLASPRRGVIAAVIRRVMLRRRIGLQNLLRAMYEQDERGRGDVGPEARPGVDIRRAPAPRRLLARASRQDLISIVGDAPQLTARGEEEARRLVRAHRLWELFLVECASLAPDHVDRDADEIEHFLPPDVLQQLEEKLRLQGRLPEDLSAVPASPHLIGEAAS